MPYGIFSIGNILFGGQFSVFSVFIMESERSMSRIVLGVLLFVFVEMVDAPKVKGGDPEFQVSTVLKAWKDYKAALHQNDISANAVIHEAQRLQGKAKWKTDWHQEAVINVSRAGQRLLVENNFLVANNGRYQFKLKILGDDRYVIDRLLPIDQVVEFAPAGSPTGNLKSIEGRVAFVLYSPLRLAGSFSFEAVLTSPSFKVINTSHGQNDAGQRIVTVDFESLGAKINESEEVKKGTISFLPDFGWLVDSARLVLESRNDSGETEEYFAELRSKIASINGLHLPLEVVHTVTDSSRIYRSSKTITNYSFDPIDPNIFYLSHYGINEPGFVQPWYVHYKWYLIGFGCLALVVLLVLLQIRKTGRSHH